MKSSKVSDESSASAEHRNSFRRKSIADGLTAPADGDYNLLISLKQLSSSQLASAQIALVNQAFIDLVKGCSENLPGAVGKLCDEVLPEGNELTKQLLIDLALKIKPSLKLARIGLAVRVLLSIFLTYTDEVTDFVVLKDYGEGGDETRTFFHISIGILTIPTLSNVFLAWIANKKKGKIAISKGAILAVLQLNPIVHGLNTWRGVETREDDVLDPLVMFLAVRLSELLFEVMPETVLQLYVIYRTNNTSGVVIFSIMSSIVSAAFIMTDNSMMYERSRMVSKEGGYLRRFKS